MYKKILVLLLLTITSAFFFSGIIRHDVAEKEYTQLASKQQFDAVGEVCINGIPSGSSILMQERFLLPAAHVFIESDFREDTIIHEGQTIVTYQPFNERIVDADHVSISINGKQLRIKRVILHPNYLDNNSEGSCDLALLELETPVKHIKPAVLNRDTDEQSSRVVGVGFSVSGVADQPETVVPLRKKIAGQNVIDSIGGFEYSGKPTLLFADFDHPTRTDCNKLGSLTPEPLEYICGGGDSGGGLFRQKNSRWELIGICTGSPTDLQQLMTTGYYGQLMLWTRVSVFDQWIAENTH